MTNSKTSKADKLGEAAAVLATLGWNPNIVLIHPLDEFDIESEKATGGNEQYVSAPNGGKFQVGTCRNSQVPQGTALVLDSSQATGPRSSERYDWNDQRSIRPKHEDVVGGRSLRLHVRSGECNRVAL